MLESEDPPKLIGSHLHVNWWNRYENRMMLYVKVEQSYTLETSNSTPRFADYASPMSHGRYAQECS